MSYNRRESDRPSGYSYLDGVPVKIGERFRPPRKVTLPLSYQQRYPVDLLNEEYDFSLENQVLELANTKRRGKEAAERAKAEKLASTIEEFTRLIDGNKTREDDFWTTRVAPSLQPNGTSNLNTRQTEEAQSIILSYKGTENISLPKAATLEPNTMLKPIQSESGVSTKPDVTITASEGLNLADFESESSPFDCMALKTLNDLEELKSVLQNTNVSGGQLRSFKEDNVCTAISITTNQPIEDNAMHHSCHSTTLSDTDSIWGVPIPGPSSVHNVPADVGPHSLPSPPVCFTQSVGAGLISNSKDSTNEDQYATLVPLRSSRSTPDLLRELGVALAAERERKRLASIASATLSGLPSSGNNNTKVELSCDSQSDAFENKDKESMGRSRACHLEDLESDTSISALIIHITDMGFPKARVARAVHKLGADYKRVVEYLCMVQTFVEGGYNAEDAEMALFLHDHNEDEAKKYLELMTQFKDLGFDEAQIQKALLQSNNDRDKALDYLVSL